MCNDLRKGEYQFGALRTKGAHVWFAYRVRRFLQVLFDERGLEICNFLTKVKAFELSQKYKEGKIILEKALIRKHLWD